MASLSALEVEVEGGGAWSGGYRQERNLKRAVRVVGDECDFGQSLKGATERIAMRGMIRSSSNAQDRGDDEQEK